MALSNLFGWNTKKETAAAAACGTACGTACGAGDK
ncbi:MAG TPA: ACGX-repeat peptide [Candidatus Blautia stercoripullorum]|uniref:ACGX-repeat peptide n=1 Tax=Candidatus Blautia stercoripullorum TaxID=2838502 RepID=A0A9D2U691_9FIRM|nr:ACGX-repeat peptide [Candidatus Blautia stercoripullorum]